MSGALTNNSLTKSTTMQMINYIHHTCNIDTLRRMHRHSHVNTDTSLQMHLHTIVRQLIHSNEGIIRPACVIDTHNIKYIYIYIYISYIQSCIYIHIYNSWKYIYILLTHIWSIQIYTQVYMNNEHIYNSDINIYI